MDVLEFREPDWQSLLGRLPVDLEASARSHGALVRRRGVADAATLLRLALVYGATPYSLRSTIFAARRPGLKWRVWRRSAMLPFYIVCSLPKAG